MGINSWFINQQTLVGSLDHEFYDFPYIYIYIGNVIIPTDELIFFRGVGIPRSPESPILETG